MGVGVGAGVVSAARDRAVRANSVSVVRRAGTSASAGASAVGRRAVKRSRTAPVSQEPRAVAGDMAGA